MSCWLFNPGKNQGQLSILPTLRQTLRRKSIVASLNEQFTRLEMLRCKMLYFADGAGLGTKSNPTFTNGIAATLARC